MADAQADTGEQNRDLEQLLKCPICHSPMEGVSITHCGHRFCTPCILQWLERDRTCPTCRAAMTDQNIIEDRDFDGLVRKLNERPLPSTNDGSGDRQGQDDGISVQNLSDILQSVMPQRDQDMRNLTDNLLAMKEREITRLEALIQSHDTTIGQLNGDVTRLKSQLDNELPRLTERTNELQEKIERKKEQKRELKDQLRQSVVNEASSRGVASNAMTEKAEVEDKLLQGAQELQKIKDELENSKKEITQLKTQMQTFKDAMKSQQAKLEKSEANGVQLKDHLNGLILQNQKLQSELAKTRQEGVWLQQQIQQLQMYEGMCKDRDQEIQDLREITLPEKDNTIVYLQKQTTELINELAILRQNTIPMSQHVAVLHAELQKTIQQLKIYYDQEYSTKLEITEKMNVTLQKRLMEVENELRSREDVGDELSTATKTYKSLVKQNSDLKDMVSNQENKIKRLQQDYVHSKGRTHELERKIQFMKELRED